MVVVKEDETPMEAARALEIHLLLDFVSRDQPTFAETCCFCFRPRKAPRAMIECLFSSATTATARVVVAHNGLLLFGATSEYGIRRRRTKEIPVLPAHPHILLEV